MSRRSIADVSVAFNLQPNVVRAIRITTNLVLLNRYPGNSVKSGLENAVGVVEITVTDEMVAKLDDRILHPVYSTFWLSYHAEVAARRAIEPFFEVEENACGTGLYIQHLQMAAVGAQVTIRATVSEVRGNRITCSIEATITGTDRCLARGTQQQAVLPTWKLAELALNAHK